MKKQLLVSIALSSLCVGSHASEGLARPNIVWLVAEDMSPWIACYGDETVPTPNLDRLAREGVRYASAFASSPVCAAARSSLITGMYATRIGTMHHRTGKPSKAAIEADPEAYADIPSYEGVPPEFVRCFPEHLRRAGYYCTNASKRDYQFKAPVTTWDHSGGRAHWRNRGEGQPFFSVFNFGGTHESQAFPGAKRRPSVVRPEEVPLPPFYPDTEAVRDAMARTYDNIAELDAWIGKRLSELEKADLLDETIVFFYSDHGVGLPRGKRSVYDTGTRVPLLVRFPDGQAAGTTESRVVSFVDLGPTVLSLAGILPDDRLDGVPFLGEYRRPGSGLAFTHADRFDSVREQTRSVSDGRFRYVRNYSTDLPYLLPVAYRERIPMTADLYALRETGPERPEQWQMTVSQRPLEELYDSATDPWEVDNLAAEPQHLERMAELRTALDDWIEDTGDLGFVLPESRLVREVLWPPEGLQPATAAPSLDFDVQSDLPVLSFSCATPGASIGFRWMESGQERSGPWTLADGPFEVPDTPGYLEVQAHRIGYLPANEILMFGDR
jgi:N-sulfoglucosamine sulfohydrolase